MISRVISGGQTGVDQGALDAAIAAGVVGWGGWCPKGRLQEDGQIPDKYFPEGSNGLEESDDSRYTERTLRNLRDSDATLILKVNKLMGRGTQLTVTKARKMEKPYRIFHPFRGGHMLKAVEWLALNDFSTLNVAGSRESSSPGIQTSTAIFMRDVLSYLYIHHRWGVRVWDARSTRKTV